MLFFTSNMLLELSLNPIEFPYSILSIALFRYSNAFSQFNAVTNWNKLTNFLNLFLWSSIILCFMLLFIAFMDYLSYFSTNVGNVLLNKVARPTFSIHFMSLQPCKDAINGHFHNLYLNREFLSIFTMSMVISCNWNVSILKFMWIIIF